MLVLGMDYVMRTVMLKLALISYLDKTIQMREDLCNYLNLKSDELKHSNNFYICFS